MSTAAERANPAYRERQAAYNKAWHEKHAKSAEYLQRKAEQMRAQQAKRPEQTIARRRVRSELEAGRMHRMPCEVCGEVKTEAHHDDYSKPLNVNWLCAPHHRARHRALKAAKVSA